MRKTRFIAIRNDALLRGDLKPMDKYLLMILENRKLFSTKKGKWYTVEIRSKKLKDLSMISDGRTLISSLNRLKKCGYIDFSLNNDIETGKEKLPNVSKIVIQIDCSPPFTLVDEEMFKMLSVLDTGDKKPHQVTVLYYLLEHYHNPEHGGDQGIASPSRSTLSKSIKIHNTKMTKLFILMHENKLCEYRQGFFYETNKRSTNRYLPNTIMHKAGEEFVGMNRRRYINHKSDAYFNIPIVED